MSLTLLLDLDDTLLGNDMGTFIPAYLQALGEHLKSHVSPNTLIPALLESTQAMLQDNSPDRSLKQVFDTGFYPTLGLDPEALQEPIASFYTDEFPKLRHLTQFKQEAVDLIDESLRRGYDLVLATNPLFPLTAVLQRLEWAGFQADRPPFLLIPSYETFHFAKPNLAFFAEILGRLGWQEGPVIMVGDDLINDIQPARSFGLPTYWITEKIPDETAATQNAQGAGELSGLLSWLESVPPDDFLPNFELPLAMLNIIRSTPAVITAFTSGLPLTIWPEEPRPQEWSLTEIVCHLRDVDAEVNLPRMKKVLTERNPFLPGIDTDQWAEQRLYYCQDGSSALSDFMKSRVELIDILQRLTPEEWDRPARHAIFGPTKLRELVGIISSHDRLHVHQAHQALEETTAVPAD
jgi:FMN phosphatase YigB (HAD superfamily)